MLTITQWSGSGRLLSRVSTEVTFWNSAEYGILCGSDFNSAEFRGDSEEVQSA
jgi:hypothetical protein